MTKRNKAARQRQRKQEEAAAAAAAAATKASFPKVTTERRPRFTSNMTTGLLNRQFASITDTLVKASRRREEELKVWRSMPRKAAYTTHATNFQNELPTTHEPDTYLSSESDDSVMGLDQGQKGSEDTASDGSSEATLTATASELEGDVQVPFGTNVAGDTHKCDGPERMIVIFDRSVEAVDQNNGGHFQPDGSGTKEMLEEIIQLSSTAKLLGNHPDEVDNLDDPKVMLADIGRMKKKASDQEPFEDDDLEIFRGKLATMLSSSSLPASVTGDADTAIQTQIQPAKADTLESGIIPYVLALMMESGGYKWEEVDCWCKYLFSNAADAHRDKQESEQMVENENEKLNATIAYVVEEEKKYRAVDEKKRLPCRLIVSNLAADVDKEAIRIFFSEYQWDMRAIIILPERDPVKRTQTAYVDMYSRKTAVRASFGTGGIFGLAVKIKLAVE